MKKPIDTLAPAQCKDEVTDILAALAVGDFTVNIPEGELRPGFEEIFAGLRLLKEDLMGYANDQKNARDNLQTRIKYERGLTLCSKELLKGEDSHSLVQNALKHLLEATDTNCIFIFINFEDDQKGLCARFMYEACNNAVTFHKGDVPQPLLEYAAFPKHVLEHMHMGRSALLTPELFPPHSQAWMKQQGVQSVLILPIHTGEGWYGFVGLAENSPERKWSEENLDILHTAAGMFGNYFEKRDMQKRRDEFASIVAHELRSPLTIINEGLENFRSGLVGKLTEKQSSLVEICSRNSSRMKRLIDNLLDLSRLESGRAKVSFNPTDISTLIAETLSVLKPDADENGITLVNHVQPNLPLINCDEDMIAQVIINLVSNAIRFAKTTITLRSHLNTAHLNISVEDDGPGIDEKDMHSVFVRFEQVIRKKVKKDPKYKGTGLGLAICKEIIHVHKGKIWVESEAGKGARFIFSLPLSP